MDYMTADKMALRHHLVRILDYAERPGNAVEVYLDRKRRAWIIGDATLRALSNSPLNREGSFEAPPVAHTAPRGRGVGSSDISGYQLAALGLLLFGGHWEFSLGRALGIASRSIKRLAALREAPIPRRVSRPLKKLCAENGIDWRKV